MAPGDAVWRVRVEWQHRAADLRYLGALEAALIAAGAVAPVLVLARVADSLTGTDALSVMLSVAADTAREAAEAGRELFERVAGESVHSVEVLTPTH